MTLKVLNMSRMQQSKSHPKAQYTLGAIYYLGALGFQY